MFKVQANSLGEHFDADLARKADLQALDALIRRTAPGLERWFYPGAPAGAPGMRMNLITPETEQVLPAAEFPGLRSQMYWSSPDRSTAGWPQSSLR